MQLFTQSMRFANFPIITLSTSYDMSATLRRRN